MRMDDAHHGKHAGSTAPHICVRLIDASLSYCMNIDLISHLRGMISCVKRKDGDFFL